MRSGTADIDACKHYPCFFIGKTRLTDQHSLFLGFFPCTGNAVCNLHQGLFDKRLDIHFSPLAANLSIPASFLNFVVNPLRPTPLKKVSV